MKKRYQNEYSGSYRPRLRQILKWRVARLFKDKDYSYRIPVLKPELRYLRSNREEATITWINHSTFLIQYRGLNIITDPIWAKQIAFRKRLSPPGIEIEHMPPIDLLLISHSHYDHLHFSTIRKLCHPLTLCIVPAGLGQKMKAKGYKNVEEMDWWDQLKVNDTSITFVPAQHWTSRTLLDANTSRWGGFVLEAPSEPCIYFAGDSAYFEGFSTIGQKFNIDIALIPIGAYDPEWIMHLQHVTPEQALECFLKLDARMMIPMHFGTFLLADDTPKEAIERLHKGAKELNIASKRICILAHGQTIHCKKRLEEK